MTDAHARRSDPLSSHLTVQSIGKDTTLRGRVLAAALSLEMYKNGDAWNDTELTERVEAMTGQRQQRNILARTRGLIEQDGLIERVGEWEFNGRRTVWFHTVSSSVVYPTYIEPAVTWTQPSLLED